MRINKNEYLTAVKNLKEDIQYYFSESKLDSLRLCYLVEEYCENFIHTEEEALLSALTFEGVLFEVTGNMYHLPSLKEDIKKFESGFTFTMINKDEYEYLKNNVNKLKKFIQSLPPDFQTWFDVP